MIHPILVTLIQYDTLLWFGSPCFSIVTWVHGPSSLYYVASIHPAGISIGSLTIIGLYVFVFMCFYWIIMVFIIVVADWCSVNLCIRPLIGLLNSNVAELGSPSPTGEEQIHNKARFTWALGSEHNCCALYKFNTCLHLPIALVMSRRWYYVIYV